MTAEISILNKSAVALAADSAVTLSSQFAPKIYNTVNKLFNLNKNFPIGIMIYGNADCMGVPWETIIKVYRKNLQQEEFNTIEEQSLDFISFLKNSKDFFPIELQQKYINTRIFNFYKNILDSINNTLYKKLIEDKITKSDKRSIINTVIESICNQCESKDFSTGFSQDDVKIFLKNYGEQIEEYKTKVFKNIQLNKKQIEKIKKAISNILFKEIIEKNTVTGIVITGFGKNEYYPAICRYEIEGMTFDKLKYKQVKTNKISNERKSLIVPFAQFDMVATFMEGINPLYKINIEAEIGKTITKLAKYINNIKEFEKIDEPLRNSIINIINENNKKLITELYDNIIKHEKAKHVNPVLEAVSYLPKEELAVMAESLVYLTYLKKRISTDPETVGGAIDVAIITKGEGFIWIKRKHYFDINLNPHFVPNNIHKFLSK